MRVLVVGAGAVGQVYGRYLALAGAEVTFFVKEKYAEECRRGFTMYPLNKKGMSPERFEGFGVMTTVAEVAGAAWDAVFLTVSSTALRDGTWLADIGKATGDATIAFLQPNIDDRDFLTSVIDPSRVVDGMIGFIAYQAPLPGETRFPQPGMAYFFPFGSPSAFSGPPARRDPVIATLRRANFPAAARRDIYATARFPNAMLYAYLAALEGAGWSFAKLRTGSFLELAAHGAAQAMVVTGQQIGRKPPLLMRLAARAFVIRVALRLAPVLIPIPLEIYLKYHFTKVGGQTRLGMRSFIELGRRAGLNVSAIERLTNLLSA